MNIVKRFIEFNELKNDKVCDLLLNLMSFEQMQETYQYFSKTGKGV